ncbi:unannotated protein [freshwater metagenome]|uniref:Unannotated protein n=1 Tax=freshwater metagenome TaxID=449393 RepID=A0A6J7RVA4_9ZZZZ|nr:hypothetical protein [Actinomycetota bacterium]MSY26546.1 hypothetical protein [Actinomycetota bacterium]MTB13484.1 hypothetical protein [Actinomycetota bacterium]MTB24277.1 hypothetical protein [Actinomycetota bacterium]
MSQDFPAIVPYGAKSNGLTAFDWAHAYYAPAPMAGAMLLELFSAKIPAYAITTEDNSPYRGISHVAPLTESIFVERSEKHRAIEIMTHIENNRIEDEFADIVGGLNLDAPNGIETPSEIDFIPELDDHFVPPIPEARPQGDTISRAAKFGVVGGAALILISQITSWNLDGMASWIGALALASGGITLWARMIPTEESGDDGAVV